MLTIASASLLFVLDLFSKRIVRWLPRADYGFIPGLHVRRVEFARAEFSRTSAKAGLVLTWLIALTCAIILVGSGRAFESPSAQVGVGAALGGATGNLLDVIRRQAITDFLDLGWWPVFNLADVGICAGLVLAFWPLV